MKNLKKIGTIVLLVIASTNLSNAQQTVSSKNTEAKMGVKGGLNLSNLYTKEVDDQNVLLGFNAGFYADLPITSSLSFQPEILFTTKGAELKYNNAFAEGTGKFRLSYIEVPLLLKANLTENFTIHFGPYAAFLVDSKITNESTNNTFNFENNVNEDDLNKFDLGLAAGLGFEIDGFGLGARYNYGLTTVGKERTFLGTTYTFPDSKNSVFSLYATVQF